jgi:cell division septation protein DedD
VELQEPHDSGVQPVDATPTRKGRVATVVDALWSKIGPSDGHIADDEIFVMLLGGDDAEATAELRRANGVTFPLYCVWKQKYGHLFYDDFRKLRRKERKRHYAGVAAVVAGAVLGGGGLVAGVISFTSGRIQPPTAVSVLSPGQHRPPFATYRAPVVSNPAFVTTPSASVAAALPSEPQTGGEVAQATPAVDQPGYKIQVAAAPNVRDGRAVVEQLTSAGYPAYLSTAIVANREVIRVRVGPFETLAAAQEKASQLQTAGYKGVWIAR